MKCNFCDKKSMFGTRLSDGFVCNKCSKTLPKIVLRKKYSVADVQMVSLLQKRPAIKDFSPTSSLGLLYVDSIHGLFAIAKYRNDFSSIFELDDLIDISFVMMDVKQYGNRFYSDVNFYFALNSTPLSFNETIARGLNCYYTVKDGIASVSEPGSVTMFREVLAQAIKNQIEHHKRRKEHSRIKDATINLYEGAKSLYMIDDDYTLDDINRIRRTLIKAFHPDNQNDIDGNFIDRIDNAYIILKANLKG